MLKTLQLGVVALIEYISACGYSTGGPTVMLGDAGTVVGATNSTFGLDSFLGIPFAQPPVGPLRWRIPISLAPKPSRVIRATAWGPACIQVPFSVTLPTVNFATSEDCLSINVVRPAGLRASAELPVLVWIHGGGFFVGASLQYDPAFLVRRSVQMVPILCLCRLRPNLSLPLADLGMTGRTNRFRFNELSTQFIRIPGLRGSFGGTERWKRHAECWLARYTSGVVMGTEEYRQIWRRPYKGVRTMHYPVKQAVDNPIISI